MGLAGEVVSSVISGGFARLNRFFFLGGLKRGMGNVKIEPFTDIFLDIGAIF